MTAIVWSVAAVFVGLVCGFLLGTSFALFREPRRLRREKARLLHCLTEILKSTEKLNADVGSHNDKLASVRRSVDVIQVTGDLNAVQAQLMDEIQAIVTCNRKLENDLTISKFELHRRAAELDRTRHEARVDKLSGLANRRAFDENFGFFLSKYHSNQVMFGLMLADIDHFKRINDAYGHAAGDAVIQRLGMVLKQSVRASDVVCRLGGDEFAILLKGESPDEFKEAATRIRNVVANTNFDLERAHGLTSVTVSVGVTAVMSGDTKESLVARADQAMYRSKELGRNLVHFSPTLESLVNVSSGSTVSL
jgi:diguanylate cyclase